MNSFVGNDIVDLSLAGVLDKYQDHKFVSRVLAPCEQTQLANSERPDLLFWFFWSAKEAAYKALKKAFPQIAFSHSKFIVDPFASQVRYHDEVVSIAWLQCNDWIHCSAIYGKILPIKNRIQKIASLSYALKDFSEQELLSIHSSESAAVRVLAKKVLQEHSIDNVQIVRKKLDRKFAPPQAFFNGKAIRGVDLSMSHDGKYVCAAVIKSLKPNC